MKDYHPVYTLKGFELTNRNSTGVGDSMPPGLPLFFYHRCIFFPKKLDKVQNLILIIKLAPGLTHASFRTAETDWLRGRRAGSRTMVHRSDRCRRRARCRPGSCLGRSCVWTEEKRFRKFVPMYINTAFKLFIFWYLRPNPRTVFLRQQVVDLRPGLPDF
jgi:hypothetical protein